MTIADITFDRVEYDSDAGRAVPPRRRPLDVRSTSTRRPRVTRFASTLRATSSASRWFVPSICSMQSGGLRITLPVPSDVSARELTPALSA